MASVKVDLSRALARAYEKANVKTVEQAVVLLAVAKSQEVMHRGALLQNPIRATAAPRVATAGPRDVASVMQCIKDHESGNYAENSHTSDGSGAFQVIPGTWRVWSARAGYPGYSYAYLAPPSVQDAVVVYMLTNGGAGNWSPRYGPDPCTVGFGG